MTKQEKTFFRCANVLNEQYQFSEAASVAIALRMCYSIKDIALCEKVWELVNKKGLVHS